MTLGLLTFENV